MASHCVHTGVLFVSVSSAGTPVAVPQCKTRLIVECSQQPATQIVYEEGNAHVGAPCQLSHDLSAPNQRFIVVATT